MLAPGFVILSQRDGDALGPPGIATVSTTDSWEDGGFALGASAAAAGMLWCDRPYFTGNPTVEWFVEQANKAAAKGAYVQCGNEVNLPLEGWSGGPEAWFAYEDAVRARVAFPDALLAMPPSPGLPGWRDWVRPEGDHACHAYGDCAGMTAIVDWYLHNTTGDVYVTECNFGAGNAVDVDAWAEDELRPFLDWCAVRERVAMAAYFAWRWDQSSTLPTSVDAAGTAVERVIRDWTPPIGGGGPVPDIVPTGLPLTVEVASPANYTTGRRTAPIGVVVHSTRGGASSPDRELLATVNWFENPKLGVSAHFVVGHDRIVRCVHDSDVAWHARTANITHLGIEIVQQTPVTAFTEAQYAAAAEICRLWAGVYGFPLVRRMTEREPGLVGHEDAEAGRVDGKTDPGSKPPGQFDWAHFMALCREETVPPTPTDVAALHDRVYALAQAIQDTAPAFEAAGCPHAAAFCREQGEATKEFVNAHKGQR